MNSKNYGPWARRSAGDEMKLLSLFLFPLSTFHATQRRARFMVGYDGCGLCQVDTFASILLVQQQRYTGYGAIK
jgi:hypothetical protein